MSLSLLHLKSLISEFVKHPKLEENLSQILRLMEEFFEYQSMGIFLRNDQNNTYRLKINRKLSHHYHKTSIINKKTFMWDLISNKETRLYDSPEDVHFEHAYKQLLITPLTFQDKQIGFFFVDKNKGSFTSEEIDLIEVFVSFMTITVTISTQQSKISTLNEFNEITELYNYRSFIKHGKQQFALAQRYNFPLSIAVLRMNKFSKSLRTFGSEKLNETLSALSELIKNHLRTTDIIGYIFSDTYAIILPETSSAQTLDAIHRLEVDLQASEDITYLRISWGVEELSSEMNTLEAILASAEEKAYEASRLIDNKIVI